MKKPCVETDGNRIFLFSDWEVGISDKCKSVLGYKWEPEYEGKPWSYPLSMQTCASLRRVWGPELTIGPILWKWASEQKEFAAQNRMIAKLPDSPLEVVKSLYPSVWDAMSRRGYQRSGAEFLARLGVAADFDEPGLGKTLTVLAAVMQRGAWDGRHLAICPKTAIEATWMYELQKWTDARVYAMPDGFEDRQVVLMDFLGDTDPGSKWLVVHPNMIQIRYAKYCKKCKLFDKKGSKHFPDEHFTNGHSLVNEIDKCDWPELFEEGFWDCVVADECHKYLLKLRPPSGRSYTTLPQWAHGMRALIKATKPGGMRLPMTGTPFRGHEENLFGILHWMDPETYSSFWRWAESCLEVVDEPYKDKRGKVLGTAKVIGRLRDDAKEQFYETLDSLSIRRTRQEVRADLPLLDVQEKWISLEGEHFDQYMAFEDTGIAKLQDGILESIGVLQEITRLRQLAFGPHKMYYFKRKPRLSDFAVLGDDELKKHALETSLAKGTMIDDYRMLPIAARSPKVTLLLDMLEERGVFGDNKSDGRKFIVASQWTQNLDAIKALLDSMRVDALMITGKVTGARRAQAVRSFRSPTGPRILLINTTAGGTSLTLDDQCDEMFVLDETWIHDDQDQLYKRIDNRGQDIRPRTVYLIRTKDTVEEGIALRNIDQKNLQSEILDGRRGVNTALQLMGVTS